MDKTVCIVPEADTDLFLRHQFALPPLTETCQPRVVAVNVICTVVCCGYEVSACHMRVVRIRIRDRESREH